MPDQPTPDTIWKQPGFDPAAKTLTSAIKAVATSPARDVPATTEAASQAAAAFAAVAEQRYAELSLRAKTAEAERDALRAAGGKLSAEDEARLAAVEQRLGL